MVRRAIHRSDGDTGERNGRREGLRNPSLTPGHRFFWRGRAKPPRSTSTRRFRLHGKMCSPPPVRLLSPGGGYIWRYGVASRTMTLHHPERHEARFAHRSSGSVTPPSPFLLLGRGFRLPNERTALAVIDVGRRDSVLLKLRRPKTSGQPESPPAWLFDSRRAARASAVVREAARREGESAWVILQGCLGSRGGDRRRRDGEPL